MYLPFQLGRLARTTDGARSDNQPSRPIWDSLHRKVYVAPRPIAIEGIPRSPLGKKVFRYRDSSDSEWGAWLSLPKRTAYESRVTTCRRPRRWLTLCLLRRSRHRVNNPASLSFTYHTEGVVRKTSVGRSTPALGEMMYEEKHATAERSRQFMLSCHLAGLFASARPPAENRRGEERTTTPSPVLPRDVPTSRPRGRASKRRRRGRPPGPRPFRRRSGIGRPVSFPWLEG